MTAATTNPDGARARAARPILTEAAYDLIKRSIIRCELPPDKHVTEEQLGARFGVGRAAVRAALKRLYQEQLVQCTGRNRYVIAPITLQHVHDLFALRLLLEPPAARQAAGRIGPEMHERLQTYGLVQYEVGNSQSAATFLACNTEFHAAIGEASGNVLLATIIRDVLDKVERVNHMSYLLRDRNQEAHDEHQELVEALVAGDAQRAEQVMIAQIKAAKQFVVEAMIASPSLLSANVVLRGR